VTRNGARANYTRGNLVDSLHFFFSNVDLPTLEHGSCQNTFPHTGQLVDVKRCLTDRRKLSLDGDGMIPNAEHLPETLGVIDCRLAPTHLDAFSAASLP
jgi:hypothetical protein